MLKPPDFWIFLFTSFLICLDLAAAFYCWSLFLISKYFEGKRFPSFDCDMLLIIVLPKQNSFFHCTHNTLFTCWIIDVKTDFEVKEEWENESMTEWI